MELGFLTPKITQHLRHGTGLPFLAGWLQARGLTTSLGIAGAVVSIKHRAQP